MKAPSPFHFRCPHCRAKLRIELRGLWLLVVFAFLFFIGMAMACVVGWGKFGTTGLLIGLGCYTLAAMLFEIVTGVLFYTYGKFSVKPPAGSTNP